MIRAILQSARPQQWTKSVVVLAGLFFSVKLTEPNWWARALIACAAFASCAAAIYILNDILDRERDRLNPRKANRPVASGRLPVPVAGAASFLFLAAGLGVSAWLRPACLAVTIVYVAMNIAYSLHLKRVAVLDAITIASGFVLRVMMGVYAIDDPLTPWIVLCVFFLALLLAFGKRRRELLNDPEQASATRRVLNTYTAQSLDSLQAFSAALAVTSYALFTILSGKNVSLILSIPLVIYGVLRYKLLVETEDAAADPAELVLKDKPLLVTSVLWILLCVAILRFDVRLFAE